MTNILNELSKEELLTYQEKHKPVPRACEFCGTVVPMKEGQKYCTPRHRAAAFTLAERVQQDRLREECERLRIENAELRKQLGESK